MRVKIATDFFLKNRLTVMRLARDFLVTERNAQLPTIKHYENLFAFSRGTVQAAMMFLIEQGCITTQFKGQLGTYLTSKNIEKLWEYSGFGTLTGALSLPLNDLVAGLATGVCECMKSGNIPFNCVFVQSSMTRIKGLERNKFDFVVASKLTEMALLADYPSLMKVMDLPGCMYSGEYVLLFSTPGRKNMEDNMTVAVDPSSVDQQYLTACVCKGRRGIKYNEQTYIKTRESVIRGESHVTVARLDTIEEKYLSQCRRLDLPQFSRDRILDFSTSVILSHRENYGIDKILSHALKPAVIADIQEQVMDRRMVPGYY